MISWSIITYVSATSIDLLKETKISRPVVKLTVAQHDTRRCFCFGPLQSGLPRDQTEMDKRTPSNQLSVLNLENVFSR